jgi:hypothetical protein
VISLRPPRVVIVFGVENLIRAVVKSISVIFIFSDNDSLRVENEPHKFQYFVPPFQELLGDPAFPLFQIRLS